jgi:U32 family peptidase
MFSVSAKPCELIAPAGSWDCARAAVENGADAIYFGLQQGLNARDRAINIPIEELPELMFYLHQRGVKGYLTLNTLVFAGELSAAEGFAREAILSGVDAFIVQDLGLLRLFHAMCPEFPIHASTQMTLSSAECIRAVEPYGVKRVVLPRELSLDEIAALRRATSVELEVFVHGALCISYSGQCLASLALGGRSGNRGQCAQACRMAYELLEKCNQCSPHTPCAGGGTRRVPATIQDAKRYWLSPGDLALCDRLPELLAAGVSALKIEGRLKEPEYVALTTRCYRRALDAALAGKPFVLEPERLEELEVAFSRGFSRGWLDGPRPHTLVPGKYTAKRGVPIGLVKAVRGDRVLIRLIRSVRRGQGIVFGELHDQDAEQGGRIYEIFLDGRSVEQADEGLQVELAFGRNDLDLKRIQSGQQIYRTDDPRLMKELRKSFGDSVVNRRVSLDLLVRATIGEMLHLEALAGSGAHCVLDSDEPLSDAIKHPLTTELLREQFGRLGRTPYELRHLNAHIEGRPMIPLSVLGKMRRIMVSSLDDSLRKTPDYSLPDQPLLPQLRSRVVACNHAIQVGQEKMSSVVASNHPSNSIIERPCLHVLCRSIEQVEAASVVDVDTIYADFRAIEDYAPAISLVRSAGKKIFLATTRIHKADSIVSLEYLENQRPDGILARHLAAIDYFHRAGLPVVPDFSLNAANDMAVGTLLELGARRVTAAFDLHQITFADLARHVDPGTIELIIHGHVPMFHTAHCLYCAAYSDQNAKPQCGRPCLTKKIHLHDRKGFQHPILVDVDCRNTVFHARPQCLAEYWTWLTNLGVRHFRIELLDHTAAETAELISLYRDLLDPRRDENDVLGHLRTVHNADINCGAWSFGRK